ncbi:MAG: DUF4185 domain-containing protein [Myxococcales bacterium]|nr:DUF4185 domain-containing protein [Myxococcales bacterium]
MRVRAGMTRIGCLALPVLWAVGVARAEPSGFGDHAGWVDEQDATTWCVPLTTGRTLESHAVRVASDGAMGPALDTLAHRARASCFRDQSLSGRARVRTTRWTKGDRTAKTMCPKSHPHPAHVRCQVKGLLGAPAYVFLGNGEATSCGDGILEVTAETGPVGQVTGGNPQEGIPLFNDTFSQASVAGTDIGAPFFTAGRMCFGFGDSFSDIVTDEGWRSNIVACTSDFDPLDGDGLTIDSWDGSSEDFAPESVASEHDPWGEGEISKIPSAGFGLTSADGEHFRFLWYFSAHHWEPGLLTNHSGFARSHNGGPWVDLGPMWPGESNFATGAVHYDRSAGFLYFFGATTFTPLLASGIRVARVPARVDAVTDATQYEYWSGFEWIPDHDGDAQEAKWEAFGPEADIIAGTDFPRFDFSVAYNGYANRFMALTLSVETGAIQVHQSPTDGVTGQWQRVDAKNMPTGGLSEDETWYDGHYAPMLSPMYMRNGGEELYVLISHWRLFHPEDEIYNVNLWKMTVTRNQGHDSCNLDDHCLH